MKHNRFLSLLAVIGLVIALVANVMPAAAYTGITLNTSTVSKMQGDTFDFPVAINVAGGLPGIRAYQFDVDYDASRLQLNATTPYVDGNALSSVAGSTSAQAVAFTLDNAGGHLTNASYYLQGGTGSFAGAATLATLKFTVKAGAANGSAFVTVKNVVLSDSVGNDVPANKITLTNGAVQVGPSANLQVTALDLNPAGAGAFSGSLKIKNIGGLASTATSVNVVATCATPATQSVSLGVLAASAEQTFPLGNYAMGTGCDTATLVATIVSNGATFTSSFSNIGDTSTGVTNIDAKLSAYLKITPDTLVNFGTLTLGTNKATGNMNVKCNTDYHVNVYDANASAWHMSEWNGSAFVGTRKLAAALDINGDGRDVSSGTFAAQSLLIDGGVAGQAGDAGQNYPLTYWQYLSYADPLLPGTSSYHLILTFNASVGL